MKKQVIKPKPMVRVNTRILPNQQDFIKKKAKDENLTEGETFRIIIDFYIVNNK
jgi:hypothetical protein